MSSARWTLVLLVATCALLSSPALAVSKRELVQSLRTAVKGGVVAQADANNQAELHTKVYDLAAEGNGHYQAKQIDSPDENGGTSVVLSNQNSIEMVTPKEARLQAERKERLQRAQELENKAEALRKQRSKTEEGRKQNEREDQTRQEKEAQRAAQERAAARQKREKAEEDARDAIRKARAEDDKKQKEKEEAERKERAKEQERVAERKRALEKRRERNRADDEKHLIVRPVINPQQGRHIQFGRKGAIKQKMDTATAFTYTLWLNPQGSQGGWSNVFHKGATDGQRNPAMWFYPGSTRLHIRSGVADSWNSGCDPEQVLPEGKWVHVAFSHRADMMRVYYNGEVVCSAQLQAPMRNGGPLYISNQWYPAARTQLADFRFYPRELTSAEIKRVMGRQLYKRGQ